MPQASIRLHSQRSINGSYDVADYDPETRTLTTVKRIEFDELVPDAIGQVSTWDGNDDPWDEIGVVTFNNADGDTIGQTRHLPALWERATDDQEPSPGYGRTPSEEERATNALLSSFGIEDN